MENNQSVLPIIEIGTSFPSYKEARKALETHFANLGHDASDFAWFWGRYDSPRGCDEHYPAGHIPYCGRAILKTRRGSLATIREERGGRHVVSALRVS